MLLFTLDDFLYALCQCACVCACASMSLVCGHPELLSVTITHVPHYHDKPVDIVFPRAAYTHVCGAAARGKA